MLDYCWQTVGRALNVDDWAALPEEARTQALFERLYDYLDGERPRMERILRRNPPDGELVESLRRHLRAEITEIMLRCPNANSGPVPFELMAAHYSAAIQLVLEWCFLRRDALTKEQAQRCIEYLLGNLEANT